MNPYHDNIHIHERFLPLLLLPCILANLWTTSKFEVWSTSVINLIVKISVCISKSGEEVQKLPYKYCPCVFSDRDGLQEMFHYLRDRIKVARRKGVSAFIFSRYTNSTEMQVLSQSSQSFNEN